MPVTCKECGSPNVNTVGVEWECEECGYTELMV